MTDDVVVLIPAGEPILAAAGWVGSACWAELRLHQVISDLLGTATVAPLAASTAGEAAANQVPSDGANGSVGGQVDGVSTSTWWTVRAHRGEVAEIWHRRLPELSEFPRAEFVVPGADGEGLAGDGDVAAALTRLLGHYRRRLEQPMGPADGPVADALAVVVARTEADLVLLAGHD